MVRVRAFGTYSFKADDPAVLLRELVGTDPAFKTDEVDEFIRHWVVSHVVSALATSGVAVLDLAAHQNEIADKLATVISQDLKHLGLQLPRFVIENVSLPPEVEAMMDKRTEMGVLGNFDQYAKFQAASAITDAAQNPGGRRRRRHRHRGDPRRAACPGPAADGPQRARPRLASRRRRCPAAPSGTSGSTASRSGRWPRVRSRPVSGSPPIRWCGRRGWLPGPGSVTSPSRPRPAALTPEPTPEPPPPGPPPPRGPPPSGSAAPPPGPAGTQHQFACPSCGAALEFAPGTAGLKCCYCGVTLEIAAPAAGSTKLDFVAYSGKAALGWGSCHRFGCPAATAGAPSRRRRSPVAARPAAGRSSSATTWAGSSRPPTGLCRSSWTERTRSPRSSSGCRHAGSRRQSSRGWNN